MISDLDETIKQLLIKKGGIDPSAVDIEFKTPNREWSASISKPTINAYLYDIRENHALRGTEFSVSRDDNGHATRKKNPSRIDLSYLITAWTSDIVDEHHLLWNALATLFRYPELPDDILQGKPLQRKRFCRTFSDCTTAPRNGLVSGCYPLDPFYKSSPEADILRDAKRE